MLKKPFSIFALALFMLIALAPTAFAQPEAWLDVVIRDFPAPSGRYTGSDGMYGFEMFDQNYGSPRKCAERIGDKSNNDVPRNGICYFAGTTHIYGSCDKPGGKALKYGNYDGNNNCSQKRGYKQGPDMVSGCSGDGWSNEVYVTRGMVNKNLD